MQKLAAASFVALATASASAQFCPVLFDSTPPSATGPGLGKFVFKDLDLLGGPEVVALDNRGFSLWTHRVTGGVIGDRVEVPIAGTPYDFDLGDLNGDGIIDAAVATDTQGVRLLFGDGTGALSLGSSLATSNGSRIVLIGQFVADPALDIVVGNPAAGSVQLWWGHGDGTFQNLGSFAVPGGPYAAVAADYNLDGLEDIAVTYFTSCCTQGVKTLINNGLGFTLDAAPSFDGGGLRLAGGDLNGDGRQDLAVANISGNSCTVSTLLRTPSAFTLGGTQAGFAGYAANRVIIGDLNGDGHADVVTADQQFGQFPGKAAVYRGTGTGTLQPVQAFDVHVEPRGLALTDMDGDGRTDIITGNVTNNGFSGNFWVLRNAMFIPQILGQPTSVSGCLGQPATFTVNVQSGSAATYQWQHQGVDLSPANPAFSGVTGPVLTIPAVSDGHMGGYRCRIGNACGGVTSQTAYLAIAADFNGDGATGLDDDIAAFFLCLGGHCCATCGTSDFNRDGAFGQDDDIEAFFLALGGGSCA